MRSELKKNRDRFTSLLLVLVPGTHPAAVFPAGSTMEQPVKSRAASGTQVTKLILLMAPAQGQ